MLGQIGGLVGYYGLAEWWNATLSPAEQSRLDGVFRPLGSTGSHPLTSGLMTRIEGETATPTGFLSELIGWLPSTPGDNALRRKLRGKLSELVTSETQPLARHFAFQVLIKEYYRDREGDPTARSLAIAMCNRQIEIAPVVREAMARVFGSALPRHVGYEQLAIIFEKDKRYGEASDLCRQAMSQGWAGEWSMRIARCQRRRSSPSIKEV